MANGRRLLITHNDGDGIGCALVALQMKDKLTDIEFCNTGKGEHNASEVLISKIIEESFKQTPLYDEILITDVSISDKVAEMVDKFCKENNVDLLMVDHHPTNKLYEKYDWVKMSEHVKEACVTPSAAAYLAMLMNDKTDVKFTYITNEYKHEIQEKAKRALDEGVDLGNQFYSDYAYSAIITNISRYDTWEWKNNPRHNPNVKEDLVTVLLSLHNEPDVLMDLYDNVLNGVYYSDENLEEYTQFINERERKFEEYMDKLVFPDIESYGGLQLAVYLHSKDVSISTFNEYIHDNWKYSKYYREYDIDVPDILISLNPENRTMSLRTQLENIDLGKIVSTKYGGGGHAKAAGAVLTPEDFTKVLLEYYKAGVDQHGKWKN